METDSKRTLPEWSGMGKSWPEGVVRVSRSELVVEYRAFALVLAVWSLTFFRRAFRCFCQCFVRSLSSLNHNEGRGSGHELPTSAEGNPWAFLASRHSSAVSSMRISISRATRRMNREGTRAQLVDASMNDVDWVQRAMLLSNTLSPALFSTILVGAVSINLQGAFFIPPFTLALPVMKRAKRAFLTDSCVAWSECLELLRLPFCATARQIYLQMGSSDSISGFIAARADWARDTENGRGPSGSGNWKPWFNVWIGLRSSSLTSQELLWLYTVRKNNFCSRRMHSGSPVCSYYLKIVYFPFLFWAAHFILHNSISQLASWFFINFIFHLVYEDRQ